MRPRTGNATLRNAKMRTDAFNSFRLPVTVKAGAARQITISGCPPAATVVPFTHVAKCRFPPVASGLGIAEFKARPNYHFTIGVGTGPPWGSGSGARTRVGSAVQTRSPV